MEALLGGLLGGLARVVPEVLKMWDRKNERKHEIDLGNQQYKLVELQGHNQLQQVEAGQISEGISAIREAYANTRTGFKFADTINALVRPWITMVIFHVWLAVKIAAYLQLRHTGIDWMTAIQTLWSEDDAAMLAGVTNFYFLNRVFERRNKSG